MLRHSKLTKCQMLDWIKERLERGEAMMTDEEIVDRFVLTGVESARVLLAELADEGAITIQWNAPGRPIALGRRERRLTNSPAPIRPALKSDPLVDAGVNKIISIVNRGSRKCQPPRPSDPSPSHAVTPNPRRSISRLPTAPGRKLESQPQRQAQAAGSKQINSKVDPATYDAVNALAKDCGLSASAMCARLVQDALTARLGRAEVPAGKPLIRAGVLRAFRADGREFGEFLTYLIDLGLEAHRQSGTAADG